MELTLYIHSLEKKLFSEKISYVQIPGTQGRFEIRWNHAPLVTTLTAGEIIYGRQDEKIHIKIKGGMAEVKNNVVHIWL